MKKLTDDIAALKPTIFVAVPRVLERIQSGIQAKLSAKPWLMRALVSLAMRWKLARVKAGAPLHKVWALALVVCVVQSLTYTSSVFSLNTRASSHLKSACLVGEVPCGGALLYESLPPRFASGPMEAVIASYEATAGARWKPGLHAPSGGLHS